MLKDGEIKEGSQMKKMLLALFGLFTLLGCIEEN